MPESWAIRTFVIEDYPQVRELWADGGPGVSLRPSDELPEIEKRLQRDPELFMVAVEGERIVGVIMAGWDGRRGTLSHLVVSQDRRGCGIGSALVAEAEERLRALGCLRTHLLVFRGNTRASELYEHLGYEAMESILVMGKDL